MIIHCKTWEEVLNLLGRMEMTSEDMMIQIDARWKDGKLEYDVCIIG